MTNKETRRLIKEDTMSAPDTILLNTQLTLLFGDRWGCYWLPLFTPAEKQNVLAFCSTYSDPDEGFHDWCVAINRKVKAWLESIHDEEGLRLFRKVRERKP